MCEGVVRACGGCATNDQFALGDLAVAGKPVAVRSQRLQDRYEARRNAAIAIDKVINREN